MYGPLPPSETLDLVSTKTLKAKGKTWYRSRKTWYRSRTRSKETTAFEASYLTENIITLAPNRPETKRRCIDSGTSVEPIKVELSDGNTEILATSLLDEVKYPYVDFKSLYALRWNVEEDFKTKKVWIELENFSGKSIESIYQDIYAKLFVQNLAGLIAWSAAPLIDDKMKHCIAKLASSSISNAIRALIDIFVLTVEPIRPGRSYERKKKFRQRHFYPQYKTIR